MGMWSCAGLLPTQSKAKHMLRHIESNVDQELTRWRVRHATGSLQSAYAEVLQHAMLNTLAFLLLLLLLRSA